MTTPSTCSDYLWLASRLARPAARGRAALVLPRAWSAAEDPEEIPFGDVDTARLEPRTPPSVEIEPCEMRTPAATRAAQRLCGPRLARIRDALATDEGAWKVQLWDRELQYVSERLVLWLYDLHADRDEHTLDTAALDLWAARARRMRNDFFAAFPSFLGADMPAVIDATPRPVCNPNGTVDLWVALSAFCAWRFEDLIAEQVWESAIAVDLADKDAAPAPAASESAASRNVWFQSISIREHAAIGVLLAAAETLAGPETIESNRRAWPTRRALMRPKAEAQRFNPATPVPLETLLFVCRLIVSFVVSARNCIKDRNIKLYHVWTEHVYEFAATRQASCLALCAAAVDPHGRVARAVHVWETAATTEYWAYTNWVRTVRPSGDIEAWCAARGRDLVCAHLALGNDAVEEPRFLWDGVTDAWRPRCEAVFGAVPPVLRRTSASVAIVVHMILRAESTLDAKDKVNSLNAVCEMLATPEALLFLRMHLGTLEPEVVAALKDVDGDAWALPCGTALARITHEVAAETRRREEWALGVQNELAWRSPHKDPYAGVPCSGAVLATLAARGAAVGVA